MAVLALVVGSVVAPRAARADAAADVEVLLKKGTDLRREGRDREALVEFQRAAKIRDTPRVQAQIGLAEQALGSWVDANGHLTHALETRDDPWIEKNRATLITAQTSIRTHLAQVEVWGAPNDATVELDGVVVGKLPSVVTWMAFGEATLKVSAQGYVTLSRPLTVLSSSRAREHVELRKLALGVGATDPAAGTATPVPDPGAPSQTGALGLAAKSPSAEEQAPDGESTPLYREWWFWAGIGVLAIGAGAGVYLLTRKSDAGCHTTPCDTL